MRFSEPQSIIRVAVVDDSATMRAMLSRFLDAEADIEVVGTATDAYAAREMIKRTNPDVITLDVEMARMNGLEFLQKIMALRPMPVIMASSLTARGAEITLRALQTGAVDCIVKPSCESGLDIESFRRDLIQKIRAAARSRTIEHLSATAQTGIFHGNPRQWLVAMGASTGGVEALSALLRFLPANFAPVVITQHMPPVFTSSFAQRLNGLCPMQVYEATDGQRIEPGNIYIAPGGRHFAVAISAGRLRCHVFDAEPVAGHKPSVDVLFTSVSPLRLQRIGVLLTGMGHDGAEGMLAMRRAGAHTLGQSRESCVVYGMPRSAMQLGAVEKELTLADIGPEILRISNEKGAI